MKKTKLILGLLALMIGTTTFTACGSSDDGGGDEPVPPVTEYTLAFASGTVTSLDFTNASPQSKVIYVVTDSPVVTAVAADPELFKVVVAGKKITVSRLGVLSDTALSSELIVNAQGSPTTLRLPITQEVKTTVVTDIPSLIVDEYSMYYQFVMVTTANYTIDSDSDWLSAQITSTTEYFAVSCKQNLTNSERTGNIIITIGGVEHLFPVTQRAAKTSDNLVYDDMIGLYTVTGVPANSSSPTTWETEIYSVDLGIPDMEFFESNNFGDDGLDSEGNFNEAYMLTRFIDGKMTFPYMKTNAADSDAVIFEQGAAWSDGTYMNFFNSDVINLSWNGAENSFSFPNTYEGKNVHYLIVKLNKATGDFIEYVGDAYKDLVFKKNPARKSTKAKNTSSRGLKFFNPDMFTNMDSTSKPIKISDLKR